MTFFVLGPQGNVGVAGQEAKSRRKSSMQAVKEVSEEQLAGLFEWKLQSGVARCSTGAVKVVIEVATEIDRRDVVSVLLEVESPPRPHARLPLSVMRTAPPMVEGCEILSDLRRAKMYPPANTAPEPIAGLERGIGAATREPRFSFVVFSCCGLSDAFFCCVPWSIGS